VRVESVTQSPQPGTADFPIGFGNRWDTSSALYLDAVMRPARGLSFTPGVRAQLFTSGTQTEPAIDPRINVRYQLAKPLSIIHGFGLAHQPPAFPLPVPGTNPSLKGGLQRAVQHNAGVEFLNSKLKASVVLFQNAYYNFTDLISAQGEDPSTTRYRGHAFGVELFARAQLHNDLLALVSYTLSRSNQSRATFSGPAMFDRPQLINAALLWNITQKWTFGARGIFYSGTPATFNDKPALKLGRAKPYWRLDWRLEKRWDWDAGGNIRLIFEVLNTTLNLEPQSRDCYESDDNITCDESKEGPITLPSIGLEVHL
jgi:outer membrane receptor for ferrienterochelin and colicin